MIHLHNHTHYSALDGFIKIDELIEQCKLNGWNAIAMTDHGCISGLPEFYKKCIEAEINPIIGCEFYCSEDVEGYRGEARYHFNAWAKNWNGVISIMRQLTTAARQFYIRPRITLKQALSFEDCIVSTACCGGPLIRDDYEGYFELLANTYGDDLRIELMPHTIIAERGNNQGKDIQAIVNTRGIEMSEKYGTKLIATNDAHFATKEDAPTHDVLLAIQTNRTLNDPYRWRMGDMFYLRSEEEMRDEFAKLPYIPADIIDAAIKNTDEFDDLCKVEMPEFPIQLPSPTEEDANAVFGRKILEGWERKIKDVIPSEKHQEYQDRLIYEIGIIRKKNFATYFLIVEDLIRWSRSNGIMIGPARGSSCGSLVCYLLDITQIDPIQWGLIFERFLQIDRLDYPDIDIDVQDDRRYEVIEYLRDKYGHDKTGLISTFSFLGPKSAFRDVCRVYNIEMQTVNKLSKLIGPGSIINEAGVVEGTYTELESFDYVHELAEFKAKYPYIIDHVARLDGTIRQMGVHAAGMVVSRTPLDQCAALVHKNDSEAICWDKRTCEDPFGLIKMDLLGLSTLSVLNSCNENIKTKHGFTIDFTKIPLDDEKTMAAFRNGEGIGVFQFENSGAQGLLKAIQVQKYREVCDVTALFRPGSLESGETKRYEKIARGEEYESYLCPELEPILKDTKSILVYQEQMMRIFVDLGGFTFAEADKMRKIVGKKLGKDVFNEHKAHFVNGCVANGIQEDIADEIFGKMVSFANYSFNLSHAIAYSHLSFWSMFLKVHFPVEYMAAMLSKTTKEDKIPAYIKECGRMGINVKMPDINLSSGNSYTISDGEIIAPLSCIKGVGEKAVAHIVEVRGDMVFLGTKDFESRIEKRKCNKRVREALFKADAFASLGEYELDDEQRVYNLKALVSIFNTLPQYGINDKRSPVNKEEIQCLMADIYDCAEERKGHVMPPFVSFKPAIMVVNNATQYEDKNLSSKSTKFIMEKLEDVGIKPNKVHYTNPLKCQWGQINSAPKECTNECVGKFLRREIEIVAPKLIVCTSSQFMKELGADATKIGDMHNRVLFNEEFGCYVLFTYSPQYAKHNAEVCEKFEEAMQTVQKIFQIED